jgi:hypothetical protein
VSHDFGPTLQAEHLCGIPRSGPQAGPTLMTSLLAKGRWEVKKRGQRHRKARPRRAAFCGKIQLEHMEELDLLSLPWVSAFR